MAPSIAELAQTTTDQVSNGVAKLNLKEAQHETQQTKPADVRFNLIPVYVYALTGFAFEFEGAVISILLPLLGRGREVPSH